MSDRLTCQLSDNRHRLSLILLYAKLFAMADSAIKTWAYAACDAVPRHLGMYKKPLGFARLLMHVQRVGCPELSKPADSITLIRCTRSRLFIR